MKKYIGIFFLVATGLQSDWLYWRTEYHTLLNEKVALEEELKQFKFRCKNERDKLSSEIQTLQNHNVALKEELELLKKNREEDKTTCERRISEIENQITILKNEGSDKEKALLDDHKKAQNRCQEEIDSLKKQLEEQSQAAIKQQEKLANFYEDKLKKCESLNQEYAEEVAKLQNLTQKQKQELEKLSSQAEELEEKLQDEIQSGKIRLKRYNNKLIINLDDKICFSSGSAKLKKGIKPALDKITQILINYPENQISIEGHTDNVPIIKGSKIADNWQLSTERALSVLRYILQNKILDSRRFSAAGFGEFHPILENNTPANRALNRRVDIVVIPK
ncbi:MAG: OmpA family protein [Leptospiraceae bacterium]|nr:OmpA family protein [Leptospiraceae bacterium]